MLPRPANRRRLRGRVGSVAIVPAPLRYLFVLLLLRVRSRALADHSVKRVLEKAVRAADVAEISGPFKVALDETHVAPVV